MLHFNITYHKGALLDSSAPFYAQKRAAAPADISAIATAPQFVLFLFISC